MEKPRIPELELTSVSQLVTLVEKYGETPDLLYRGQSAEHKELTTSIERLQDRKFVPQAVDAPGEAVNADDYNLRGPYRHLASYEQQSLGEFKRRARHFVSDLPRADNHFEWLALMQHHGAPTRLLDVTQSIFVALYFATSHSGESDGIIYVMFTPGFAFDRAGFGNSYLKSVIQKLHKSANYSMDQIANQVIGSQEQCGYGLIEIKNTSPSKRELAQQGCFLMPLALSRSFEFNAFTLYEAMGPTWQLPSENIVELEIHDYLN